MSPMETDKEGAALHYLWSAIDGLKELESLSETANHEIWTASNVLKDLVQRRIREKRVRYHERPIAS